VGKALKVGLIISAMLLSILFGSFFLHPRETSVINFTTKSGLSGQVRVQMPESVTAGDKNKLNVNLVVPPVNALTSLLKFTGRLEAGFEEVRPSGFIHITASAGQTVNFKWNFIAGKKGPYLAILWLYVDSGDGDELVLARTMEVKSKMLLGLRMGTFRAIIGGLMVVPIVLVAVDWIRRKKPGEQL
jgi:hypothetical protein